MLGEVEVLLGHEYALLEEVLVDLLAIGLGDKPAAAVSVCALAFSVQWVYVHCHEFQALFGESCTMRVSSRE